MATLRSRENDRTKNDRGTVCILKVLR